MASLVATHSRSATLSSPNKGQQLQEFVSHFSREQYKDNSIRKSLTRVTYALYGVRVHNSTKLLLLLEAHNDEGVSYHS